MSINVYWACLEDEWMAATPPELVSKTYFKKNLVDNSNPLSYIHKCPGFSKNLKNLYTMTSLYDYEFVASNETIVSKNYNQKFLEEHVVVRSFEKKFFSFKTRFIYFTDSSNLDVTFYEYPYLDDNIITSRCIPVAGQFNIGKWFRSTEFAFYLKNNVFLASHKK